VAIDISDADGGGVRQRQRQVFADALHAAGRPPRYR